MVLLPVIGKRSEGLNLYSFVLATADDPVVRPMKKFVAVRVGDTVDDGCTVTNSVKNSITYSRVDGQLPTHHVLPNGDLVFRYDSLSDSGEYQCKALTEKGLYSASFFGKCPSRVIRLYSQPSLYSNSRATRESMVRV